MWYRICLIGGKDEDASKILAYLLNRCFNVLLLVIMLDELEIILWAKNQKQLFEIGASFADEKSKIKCHYQHVSKPS